MADFEKLRRIVLEDEALQRRLLAQEDADRFIELVLDMARERGLAVSQEDVRGAIGEGRRGRADR